MPRKFLSVPVINNASLGERQIMVVASDPTLDRTKDVMRPEGVVLENYRQNNIVLANHDPTQPIGNATAAVVNGRVEALIDFAPKGISPRADEYCGLAKAGVIRAVSVGFDPIEVEPNKAGGFNYNKWELMELSLVAVPANPSARIIARSADRRAELKVGASRNLPVAADVAWDVEAAAASIFDHCKFDGDSPDVNFARKGFLVYDSADPMNRDAYRFPFAKMIDGRLTASLAGVRAATLALDADRGPDVPRDIEAKAAAVLAHYQAKETPVRIKGLWELSMLCEVLAMLDYVQSSALDEAAYEGDGSKVPGMLADSMRQLGAALVAMSEEEVSEILAAAGGTKALAASRVKAGRALSAGNAEHVDAINKALEGVAAAHAKAAGFHDKAHGAINDASANLAVAADHAKALQPKPDDPDAPDQDDEELAFEVERRKRVLLISESEPV